MFQKPNLRKARKEESRNPHFRANAWFKILGVECTVSPTEGRRQKRRFKRAAVPSYHPVPCPDLTLVQGPGSNVCKAPSCCHCCGAHLEPPPEPGESSRGREHPPLSWLLGLTSFLSTPFLERELDREGLLCAFVHPLRRVRPVPTQPAAATQSAGGLTVPSYCSLPPSAHVHGPQQWCPAGDEMS